MTRLLRPVLWVLIMLALLPVSAFTLQAQSACGTAPEPRLIVGEEGRVLPGDPNNMRDQPAKSGALVGAIAGGDRFQVLEGPVCADELNWWKVEYNGQQGWTVEGNNGEYWVEPYKEVVVTYDPAPVFEPPYELINLPKVGDTVRVTVGDSALRFRAEPLRDAEITGAAEEGELLTLLDGPKDSEGYNWWLVQDADGVQGWAIEGMLGQDPDRSSEALFSQTFIALCPEVTNRVAFIHHGMLYTASQEGDQICQMQKLRGPWLHTFWSYLVYLPNSVHWNPDGQSLAFISGEHNFYQLYTLSVDGSTLTNLTPGSNVIWMDWSPDGKRIALSRILEGQSTAQIWVINADGSFPVAISSGNTMKPWVQWLDNNRLVYVEEIGKARDQMHAPTDYKFYVVGADLSQPQPPIEVNLDVRGMRASDDGRYLMVQGFEHDEFDSPTNFRLEVFDLATRASIFTTDQYNYSVSWKPGTHVLVLRSGEFWTTFDAATGTQENGKLSDTEFFGYSDDWIDDHRLYAYDDEHTYLIDLDASSITKLGFSFTDDLYVDPLYVQP